MFRHLRNLILLVFLLLFSNAPTCFDQSVYAQESKEESVVTSTTNAKTGDARPVSESSAGGEEATAEGAKQQQTPARFVLPAEQHAWANFQPGAWREVRITTETFNSRGKVINRSVTTQKEILKAKSEETYSLDLQATVDLIGKRIVGDWKQRVLKLATNRAGEITGMQKKENQIISYEGEEVECEIWELRYLDDSRQMVDRIVYSPQRYPFVIRRDSKEIQDDSQAQPVEEQVEVIASTIPFVIEGKMTMCCSQRTTRRRAKGNSLRVTFLAPTVPGGEVAAWSSDFDSQRQLTRWSTFELISYGLAISPQLDEERR